MEEEKQIPKVSFFDEARWKPFLDKSSKLDQCNQNTELECLKDISQVVPLLSALTDSAMQEPITPAEKDYFLTQFVPQLARNLIGNKKYYTIEGYLLADSMIQQIVKIIAFHLGKEESPKLSDTFKYIFDCSKDFYK